MTIRHRPGEKMGLGKEPALDSGERNKEGLPPSTVVMCSRRKNNTIEKRRSLPCPHRSSPQAPGSSHHFTPARQTTSAMSTNQHTYICVKYLGTTVGREEPGPTDSPSCWIVDSDWVPAPPSPPPVALSWRSDVLSYSMRVCRRTPRCRDGETAWGARARRIYA